MELDGDVPSECDPKASNSAQDVLRGRKGGFDGHTCRQQLQEIKPPHIFTCMCHQVRSFHQS